MRSTTETRIWTPGRMTALLVIAVAVAFLLHTRLEHRAGWAAVPSGAHAGQLTLKPCTYAKLPADCGTLVVPENRADPHSRLIALPVTRIRSRSAHPAEPIFRMEGGPGRSNMDFPFAGRYIDHHDLVLLGYRGVDGSASLDCPEVTDARRHTADLVSASAVSASTRAMRSCVDRLRAHGYDLAGYTLAQRVDDFESARHAMGYGPVDLISESFGTRLALVYAWRHPRSVHRSVMIGVNPPGHFVWQPEQTEAQLRRYAALCGTACAASLRTPLPKRWGPLPIHRGNVETTSFFGLMEASSAAAPIAAPQTFDAWRAAARGDASGLWLESLAGGLIFPHAENWGDAAAMGRIDAATAATHFAQRDPHAILDDAGSRFLWAGGGLASAWPAGPDEAEYAVMRDSDVPTLLISGKLDGATPPENATRELLPHLRNGHQVLLDGFGHTTDFWNNQVAAGNHLINQYFDSGRVDASRYVPQKIDFTPSTTQTALAKKLAGIMLALALFSGLSLVWMVRRRRMGRVTRIAVRSVWALLIGLGGWFAVALVALIVAPSVPIDALLVLVGGMGVPVAIACYCGWRGPGRAVSNAIGVAAAAGGALIGAWLGLESATAPLAIVTTLVGAVAGANLALIACDIVAETRRGRQSDGPAASRELVGAVA